MNRRIFNVSWIDIFRISLALTSGFIFYNLFSVSPAVAVSEKETILTSFVRGETLAIVETEVSTVLVQQTLDQIVIIEYWYSDTGQIHYSPIFETAASESRNITIGKYANVIWVSIYNSEANESFVVPVKAMGEILEIYFPVIKNE